ncbi:conserved hypothetical protein [Methanolacinia petrolearia DSM 11571]|uniref:Uncharacterized protein n=1 Tax=Methanolacinia petrolearia (strain DSM 11571 / OCM 486 / SEBR 4847) TaxID=679926 RepID=E1RI50_METP4|nr:conserved hypothetical protein [Methanolacinia petrolearia DSM 11571]
MGEKNLDYTGIRPDNQDKRRVFTFLRFPAFRISVLLIIGFLLLCPGAFAHVPDGSVASEAPEVDLGAITILDGDEEIEISLDDVAEYHGLMTNSEPDACTCCICMFRAAKVGLGELYGDEIPERSDIGITSYLPSPGAVHTAMLITGTGPKLECGNPGQFRLLYLNETEIEDLSNPNLKSASADNSAENYHFIFTRLSTGESVEISVSGEMFPSDYFELRKKVQIEMTATEDEKNLFSSEWSGTRNKFLESQDWEIYNEIDEPEEEPEEEPDVAGGAAFLAFLICMLVVFAVFARR